MPTGVNVSGLRQTIRGLEKLGVGVEELKGAMSKISSKTVTDAKTLAPVGTGSLASTVRASKAKAKATLRAGTKSTYWASFTEYGTSSQSAQNWMHKAIESNESYAAQQIEAELRQLANRYL